MGIGMMIATGAEKVELAGVHEIACFIPDEGKKAICAALHPLGGEIAIAMNCPGGAELALFDETLQSKKVLDLTGPEKTKRVQERRGLWGVQIEEHVLGEDTIATIVYSRTGKVLACRTMHTLQLWENGCAVRIHTPLELQDREKRVVFSGDENMVLTCDNEKTVCRLWDVRTGEVRADINERDKYRNFTDMAYLPGKGFLVIERYGTLQLFDDVEFEVDEYRQRVSYDFLQEIDEYDRFEVFRRSGPEIRRTELEGYRRLFAGADGNSIFLIGQGGIDIYDWNKWSIRDHLDICCGGAVCVSADGAVVAAEEEGTVRLWSVSAKTVLHEIPMPDGPVRSLSFSPDGSRLCICLDRRVILMRLDWKGSPAEWADWSEEAEEHCRHFLRKYGAALTPAVADYLSIELQNMGIGPVSPEEILKKMAEYYEEFVREHHQSQNNVESYMEKKNKEFWGDPFEEQKKGREILMKAAGALLLGIVLILAGAAGVWISFARLGADRMIPAVLAGVVGLDMIVAGIIVIRENKKKIQW